MPHGAFYAFPNMSSFGRTSAEIADHLLYDAGVCGLAGTAFGVHGEGYLRFSYANSRENIGPALERIGESLARLDRTGELRGGRVGAGLVTATRPDLVDELYERSTASFADWELVQEIIDESIDLALNYRQTGHPGGSRSKVHLFVSLLLSGAHALGHPPPVAPVRRPLRPRRPGTRVPLIYATLAVLNEALRARAERDPDRAFAFPDDGRWALTWEDLLKLRRRGGLPGHAEMEGKTLFLKFNTGPSGHGMPPAAGEAVALKLRRRGRRSRSSRSRARAA